MEDTILSKSVSKSQCTICQRAFDYKKDLKRHFDAVHEGKKENFCDSCGKSFSSISSLNGHIKRVHEKVERKFVCNQCERRFYTNSELKNHILTVHEKGKLFSVTNVKKHSNKKEECLHCGKVLKNKRCLLSHIKSIHTKERDHVCNICQQAFTQSSALNKHKKGSP